MLAPQTSAGGADPPVASAPPPVLVVAPMEPTPSAEPDTALSSALLSGFDRSACALEFFDADYVRWRVAERDARQDPGTRGDRCLVFRGGVAVRRVWNYPPAWQDLPVEALIALSWER